MLVEQVDFVSVPTRDAARGVAWYRDLLGLRVADVSAAVEGVRRAGSEVIGIEDSGVCHMGFVKDLDGNVLILHRRYARRERRAEG